MLARLLARRRQSTVALTLAQARIPSPRQRREQDPMRVASFGLMLPSPDKASHVEGKASSLGHGRWLGHRQTKEEMGEKKEEKNRKIKN